MANTKLKNVSDRTFLIAGEQTLKPGSTIAVDSATADHLMGMYPGELIDLQKALEADAAAASTPAEPDAGAMTVVQLRAALKEKGISHAANASKAELVALLTGKAAESAEVVEPTVLAADTVLTEGVVYSDANGLYVGKLNNGVVGLLPVAQLTADEKAVLVAEGKLTA